MKYFIKAILFMALASHSLNAIAEREDAVTENFAGSRNLPDGSAYVMFLAEVEGLKNVPIHAGHVISKALGLNLDTREGADVAQQRIAWFVASAEEMRQEVADEAQLILCPVGWSEMTYEEIKAARFALEDAQNRIHGEYFNVAIEYLPSTEVKAFQGYILGVKERTTWTRIDAEKYYGDEAESKAKEYQTALCTNDSKLAGGHNHGEGYTDFGIAARFILRTSARANHYFAHARLHLRSREQR